MMLQPRRGHTVAVILLCSFSTSEQYQPPGDSLRVGLPARQISIAFPKAYVRSYIRDAAYKLYARPWAACTSLMGPTCFYEEAQGESIRPCDASSWLENAGPPEGSGVPARENERAASSGGIMEQYMEASQQQLGAVHGNAGSSISSEHWRHIGAARKGKLDDVVHVQVGRSVQSVYEEQRHGTDVPDDADSEQVCQNDHDHRHDGGF